uniref:Uncharacterized protein n=1 Tax=Arundo donax TaxID=35708 RepID=A0A0A9HHM9_ARUDO
MRCTSSMLRRSTPRTERYSSSRSRRTAQ